MAGTLAQPEAPARFLGDALGLPLGAYRRDHVQSCVMRAMRREGTQDINSLVARVDADPAVRTRLRRAIAVATTGLFRDPIQLRWIDSTIMPELRSQAKHVRAWSAGCAAGEEAFTLAMMIEWHGMLGRSDVVGSDILEESLAEAETGVVSGAKIPGGLRGRVAWDLRDLLSAGPPEGQFDLVLCRNLLSFLTPVAADVLTRTLVASLAIGGIVAVGRDERIEAAGPLGLVPLAPNTWRRIR